MPLTGSPVKRILIVLGLVGVIVACWSWIYCTQIGSPAYIRPLHQGIGQVLAEETARVLGNKGKIVVVATTPSQFPELKAQLDAFEQSLRQAGSIAIKERQIINADDPKYGLGRGLSAHRFLRIVSTHPEADAIVSFVGVPNLTDDDLQRLPKTSLKFIAEVKSPERTLPWLKKGLLQAAVVSRFAFPAPGPKHPRTPRQWFDRYFQVVTPDLLPTAAP